MLSGIELTENQEGYANAQPDGSCVAYWDSIGCVWTIGFGCTGKDITRGTHWTRDYAVQRLQLAWNAARAGVLRASPILANYPNRLDACTDFAYNEGIGAFASSTLHSLINRQDWSAAAAQFARWDVGGGRVVAALVRRRASEAALFQLVATTATPATPFPPPMPQPTTAAGISMPSLSVAPELDLGNTRSDFGLDTSSLPALFSTFAKALASLLRNQ